MGLFRHSQNQIETRAVVDSTPSPTTEGTESALLQAISGEVAITEDVALSIPSFSSAVDFISNTIAMLPIKLYSEDKTTKTTAEITDDYRLKLLNDETGDLLNAYQTKQAMVRDCLLGGAGYVYINKTGARIKSLHYVDKDKITVQDGYNPIYKNAEIRVNGTAYLPDDFLILTRSTKDGVSGRSAVEQFAMLLSTMRNNLTLENSVSKTGGNKKGFLVSPKKMDDPAIAKLRTAWERLYNNNSNNLMILQDGTDFKESSSTLAEAQLNENKLTNSDLIASIFGLSSAFLAGKYTEADYQAAIKSAVLPLIASLESQLNRSLLLEREKDTLYFELDLSEIQKVDIKTRYEAYAIGLANNILQIDEVRYLENLQPLGVNYIKLGLQDVLLDPKTNTIYTANTNKTTVLGEGGDVQDDKDRAEG